MNTQQLKEKAKELIQHEVREYLNNEDIKFHEEVVREFHWVIDDYFNEIRKILLKPYSDVTNLEFSKERTMDAMYILVQAVLEDALPNIHMKPEWTRDDQWKEMVRRANLNRKQTKENTND